MSRLIVYAIFIAVIIYIAAEILKFLSAINSTKSQLSKDKAAFKANLDSSQLIDWRWEEVNTLSMMIDYGISQYNMITSAKEGDYLSIFDEPIGHLLSKEYGDRELLYILISDGVFELYKNDVGEVKLTVADRTHKINLTENSISFQIGSDSYLMNKSGGRASIFLNEKKIIVTNQKEDKEKSMTRLVPIKPDPLKPNQEHVVKFLLLFYLIWRHES